MSQSHGATGTNGTDASGADRGWGNRVELSSIDANSLLARSKLHVRWQQFSHLPGKLIQTVSGDGYLVRGGINSDGKIDFSIMLLNMAAPLTMSDLML